MFDLIAIGNISFDLYFQGETLTHKRNRFSLAIGGKYNADYFYESLGGGGANVAIGAARHGLKSAILGKIGNNQFKKMILAHLDEHGVSEKLCTFKDEYLKISSILLSPCANVRSSTTKRLTNTFSSGRRALISLKNAKYVYVSNLSARTS
jgi:sugar/nucleoside kinase (ribokinase family)